MNADVMKAETAVPTGSELVITPTDLRKGVTAQGVDVFLGPGLRDALAGPLAGTCAKTFDKGCVDALAEKVNIRQALVSRSPGFAIAVLSSAIPALIALLVQQRLEQSKGQQTLDTHYHIPASNVSQLQSQTATSIVFETSPGALITVTPTTVPTPAPTPATVTTLAADAQGHHKEDLLLSLPPQAADLLKQLINQSGQCSSAGRRGRLRLRGKGPDLYLFTNVAIWVLPNAAPHQLLNGFDLQGIPQQLVHYRGTKLFCQHV